MSEPSLITKFVDSGGLRTSSASDTDDLFIGCASFEPRSSCITDCMLGNYRTKRSAVYVNREFATLGATAQCLATMKANLERSSETFLGVFEGSWENAAEQFQVLRKMIAPDGIRHESLRITLDITTFNREALLAALGVVRWAYPRSVVRLAYVSPQEYNPSGRAALEKIGAGSISNINPALISEHVWLSRGFRKLRNAIGFAGFQQPNLPSLLILLPGFEIERPLTLVDNLEPSMVLLGKPVDATRDAFYERSQQSKDQMLRLFKARQPVIEFEFSCKVIEKAFGMIKAVVEKYYTSHNIFLTSMSTKPTLVASLLLAEMFDKIQLTSSVPGEYNVDDYSGGTHSVTFFTMPEKQGNAHSGSAVPSNTKPLESGKR